jgi:hypothetical protein
MKRAAFLCAVVCVVTMMSTVAGSLARESVDAITAATTNNQCKFVTPFTVTNSTASIAWSFDHIDGSGVLKYWTTATDTIAVTLTAAQRASKTISLSGLKPGTTYSINLLLSKSGETSAVATGSFKTTGATNVLMRNTKFSGRAASLQGKTIVFGSQGLPGDAMVIFDCRGRKVLKHRVAQGEMVR